MIKKPRLPPGDDREGQSVRTLWLRTMRLKGRQSEWGWMSSVMLQAVSGASGNLRTDRSGDGGRRSGQTKPGQQEEVAELERRGASIQAP